MARRPDLEIDSWRANSENTLWLLLSVLAVMVPHMVRMPLWCSGAFLGLLTWRWLIISRGQWSPGRSVTIVLAVASFVAVSIQYRSLAGRDPGVALLALLAGMKLLETRTARDAYVALFLVYFLIITNFLYSQSILMGLYMVCVAVLTTSALISLQHSNSELPPRQRLRVAGSLLTQAVPLMLVAFVLFPRLPGPLWGLPKDAHAGVTGLSESMSPGQISNLSRSNAVAFRVTFQGPAPSAADMYWRGPVLDNFDGLEWTRANRQGSAAVPQFLTERVGDPVDYVVTLEPTQHRWLFALEMNATLPDRAYFNTAGEIRVQEPIRELRQYGVRSYLNYIYRQTTPRELRHALALRQPFHPRARALARKWRAEAASPQEIVDRALAFFREQPFEYTLTPDRIDGDSVDEFLFLTRSGFCEHYAGAFVVLMRAAGIPARVVTGYQGAERNAIGDYWVVRQRDAHAWAEVWLEDRGWARVDPTAAVAPARIDRGVDAALPDSSTDAVFGMARRDDVGRWWWQVQQAWDTVDNTWNQWILGYGPERQREFLRELGFDVKSWRDIGLIFIAAAFLALLLVTLWMWRRREPVDPVARLYRRFSRRLARHGVERFSHEGPRDFGARAALALPAAADDIGAVIDAYERIRYGPPGSGNLNELKHRVRALRL
ncbi:MAG: DUF3488 and transglutaminase-like domain-containing protein [Pseudomonadota bacterium]